MEKDLLKERLANVHERIEKTCLKIGQDPKNIKLLLATKMVPSEIILKAFELNECLIGENRVQELLQKYDSLLVKEHSTHLIGHLQSNKINKIINKVSCVESVDNIELASKINDKLCEINQTLDILIEVNTSGEKSKYGLSPSEVLSVIEKCSMFPFLKIKGLMTIGSLTENVNEIRKCFRLLKQISEKIKQERFENVSMEVLSMGMSSDFEIAIEEGATEIRLGSIIFGSRSYT